MWFAQTNPKAGPDGNVAVLFAVRGKDQKHHQVEGFPVGKQPHQCDHAQMLLDHLAQTANVSASVLLKTSALGFCQVQGSLPPTLSCLTTGLCTLAAVPTVNRASLFSR